MADLHKNFMLDLGGLLREEALRARQAFRAAKGTGDEAYQSGRTMAYYEVLSLLVDQAKAFGLPIAELNLDGLDPESYLADTPIR
jgi:hypothetical protein